MSSASSPAVSVCMPVLNGKRFFPTAFASLAAQRFRDFEVIVVDDGSTDDSAAEAARCLERHGLRGRVICISNRGAEQARDVACSSARAPLIAHLDCDDRWEPCYLGASVRALLEHPEVDLVYSDVIQEYSDGRKLLKSTMATWIDKALAVPYDDLYIYASRQFFGPLLSGNVLVSSCTVYRRSLYEALDGYTGVLPDTRISLDWCFGLRASHRSSIAFIPHPLVHRSMYEGSTSASPTQFVSCNVRILRWVLSHLDCTAREIQAARAYGATISTWAWDIELRVERHNLAAAMWAAKSLRFRGSAKATRLLFLALIPRYVVEWVREIRRSLFSRSLPKGTISETVSLQGVDCGAQSPAPGSRKQHDIGPGDESPSEASCTS